MEASYWKERWKRNEIQFHQPQINEKLQKYHSLLDLKAKDGIFVPLCGKSLDLLYLRDHGLQVVGVEISPQAISSFFQENQLSFEEYANSTDSSFVSYSTENLEILCGDFFALNACSSLHFPQVKAIYDRAALVALPPEMRKAYTDLLPRIFPGPLKILLLTIQHGQDGQDNQEGPPFSIPPEEVQSLYSWAGSIQLLESEKKEERGRMIEANVFLISV